MRQVYAFKLVLSAHWLLVRYRRRRCRCCCYDCVTAHEQCGKIGACCASGCSAQWISGLELDGNDGHKLPVW